MKKTCYLMVIAAFAFSCKKETIPDPIVPPPVPKPFEEIWSIDKSDAPSIPLILYKDFVLYTEGGQSGNAQILIAADLKTGIKAWELQLNVNTSAVIKDIIDHYLFYKYTDGGVTGLQQIDLDTRQISTIQLPSNHHFVSCQVWGSGLLIRADGEGRNKTFLYNPEDGTLKTIHSAKDGSNGDHEAGPLVAWQNQSGDTLLSTLEWINSVPSKSEIRTVNINKGDTLYRMETSQDNSAIYPPNGFFYQNNRLYLFLLGNGGDDRAKVRCFNAITGAEIWTYVSDASFLHYPEKIAFETNTILLFGGIATRLEALSMSSGQQLWTIPLPPLFHPSGLCTGSGQFFYTLGGGLTAIDGATGKESWHYQSPYTSGSLPGFWLDPAFQESSRTLVVFNEKEKALLVGIKVN